MAFNLGGIASIGSGGGIGADLTSGLGNAAAAPATPPANATSGVATATPANGPAATTSLSNEATAGAGNKSAEHPGFQGAFSQNVAALRNGGQGDTASEQPPLKPGMGMRGGPDKNVTSAQNALKARGFDVGKHGADGRYGGDTTKAVKAAQKKLGMEQTGVANADFMNKLNAMPTTQQANGQPGTGGSQETKPLGEAGKTQPTGQQAGQPTNQPSTNGPQSNAGTSPGTKTSGNAGSGVKVEGTYYKGNKTDGGGLDRKEKPLQSDTVAADPRVPYGTVVKFQDGTTKTIKDTGGDFYNTLDKNGMPRRMDFHSQTGDGRFVKQMEGLYHPDGKTAYTADEIKSWLNNKNVNSHPPTYMNNHTFRQLNPNDF